ncbi:peptidyl-tRNA hydrolase [Dipodascopsis tothii]|uniref:peptidyl-tRNA hydrolase n=1 Tax=Dipodascopsis tothii TaxID=44089 RepID=UPI0034CDC591
MAGRLHSIVCSIGNPGSQYAGTRHSVGHLMVDLVREHLRAAPFQTVPGLKGAVTLARGSAGDVLLFRSDSYMNESGGPVRAVVKHAAREYGGPAPVAIVHDELELALGQIKLRTGGSARGHRGITDVIARLGTKDFYRLQVGIGRPESRRPNDVADYVLGRFTRYERQVLLETSFPLLLDALARVK